MGRVSNKTKQRRAIGKEVAERRYKDYHKKSEDKPVVIKKTEQIPLNDKKKPGPKSGFKRKPSTDELTPISKRRKRSNKFSTESKIFSQKEKKVFYDCLKENGISCLNDESLLEQLFPNRSMTEIKGMIDGFSRKGQDLNRKPEDITVDPNASKQPIEKWFDLIHQMVPNPSKKDDISAVLIDLFDDIRNEWPQENETDLLKPNYRSVYDCIAAALNGKYAKQMEPINAFVVIKLIEELKQLIKNDLNKAELSFLKSGIWWEIPNQTNAQKSNGDVFRAIHSQRQLQDSSQSTESNVSNEVEYPTPSGSGYQSCDSQEPVASVEQTAEPNQDSSFEELKSYPKLRKIIECLNPLRVPIELIADEYNRW